MKNPFCTTLPVEHGGFSNRKDEVDQVCDSIARYGQSVAIIGEPRTGKTSLLKYIQTQEVGMKLFGDDARNLIFSFLDFRTFDSVTFREFWERGLAPCVNRMEISNNNNFLSSYKKFKDSNYSSAYLEEVIKQIHLSGQKLVVLIDEFDTAISRTVINNRELVFGSIRSFSSTSKGALIFVIAITCDLVTLEELARPDNKLGSQYFNTFMPVHLSAFDRSAIDEILRAGQFNNDDANFIEFIAGGHPYFIQSAASLLWNSYKTESLGALQRAEAVSQKLTKVINPTLHFIWNRWTPEMRLAFTLVALTELPRIGNMKFRMETLNEKKIDLADEILTLRNMGYICEGNGNGSEWMINGKILMWFLLERIRAGINKKDDLGEWLRLNGWNGFFTNKQKEEILEMAKLSAKWFGETLVKGFGALLPELIKKSLGI